MVVITQALLMRCFNKIGFIALPLKWVLFRYDCTFYVCIIANSRSDQLHLVLVVVVLSAHVHSYTWSVKLCSCTFNMTDSKACLLKFALVASFLFGLLLFKSKGKDVDKFTKTKNDDRLCQPKTRVAFAKTHKTGSSTIQVNHFHIISSYGTKKTFQTDVKLSLYVT